MKHEQWRDIPGFECRYQVSDMGRVRNQGTGQVLKPFPHRDGYLQVKLCGGGKQRTRFVHRLVATAFIPNPRALPEVDHDDTDKTHNAKGNLVWVTHHENMQRAAACGLLGGKSVNAGDTNGQAKLTWALVAEIRDQAKNGASHARIAVLYGVSRRAVGMIVSGKRWVSE
ncbi:NUMOD4 domain-containing protein [Burkholderia contaminans]|uniref:NUMOD4 domain-containing protein n=1 Tax=Burkholderia contaminans TaxID=488447 RepID=UPI00158B539F|nr:NUMOD4 domain-containing protein [Burkholderia contaminans]